MKLQGTKILAVIAFFSLLTFAAEIPDNVLPNGVGVNIHFTRGNAKDLDLIAAAGFKVVRMDFLWGRTERRKGEYDWSEYDELTTELERRGIRPYYILDYSNPLYEATVITQKPGYVTGGRSEHRFAAASGKHRRFCAMGRFCRRALSRPPCHLGNLE